MELINGRDIVIVGQQPWDTEIGSNCKNIAIEFAKTNRVLYVNSPLDRITKIRHGGDPKVQKRVLLIEGKNTVIELVHPNLWVFQPEEIIESINWIKFAAIFDFFNLRNNKIIAKEINKAQLKLSFKNIILFNDNDIFRSFYLKELLKPKVSVYYSRDYLLASGYWKHHGLRLEHKLMAKSDVCVANSSYLASLCEKYNANAFDVGQGCDLKPYNNSALNKLPLELHSICKPLIGYVGALLSSRLDIDIIRYIATARPTWNVVLVGPEDEAFKKSDLHHMDNIHFLGPKLPEQLPAYIHSFDVCINPQVVNELTIGNYPRKIDEYLAVGKPVVATRTKTMEVFEGHCSLATDKQQFVDLIENCMKINSEELAIERKEFASTHTWENSVGKIYDSIRQYEVGHLSTA
jgi:teichuronic acid biosynthesis glycosyltransferase TuaH